MILSWLVALSFISLVSSLPDGKVRPGHMELDPRFGHIFNTSFFLNYDESRIAGGGWESEPHSRPYQAGIYVTLSTGVSSFCGGSLISPYSVLTAAHCVDDIRDGHFAEVYLGAHNMPPKDTDVGWTLVYGSVIHIYPDWNRATLEHDIAIVQFYPGVQETDTIKYISVATDPSETYLGRRALASGWGLPGDGHTSASPVLREVTSDIVSNVACRLAYLGTIRRSHICISGEEKRSTCRGDSGGPLVVDDIQVGVVSFGTSAGCEVGWPPAFTRVTSYTDWIKAHMDSPW